MTSAPRFPGFRASFLLIAVLLGTALLQGAPGINRIHTIRIAFGAGYSLPMVVGLAIVGLAWTAPCYLWRRANVLVYGYATTCVTWSFAGASRVPWWFLSQKSQTAHIVPPSPGTVLVAVLLIAAVLGFLLVQDLESYALAAQDRGLEAELVRTDLPRIARARAMVVLATLVAGILLTIIFEDWIGAANLPTLSGTAWGAWVLILVGALMLGVLLVLGRGVRHAPPRSPTTGPSNTATTSSMFAPPPASAAVPSGDDASPPS